MKQYTLPKEFAQKWIAALRSGEYKQGRGYLFNQELYGYTEAQPEQPHYCCLGVACIVGGATIDEIRYKEVIDEESINIYVPKQLIGNPCESMRNPNPLIKILTEMNDEINGEFTFSVIADWIENNIEFI